MVLLQVPILFSGYNTFSPPCRHGRHISTCVCLHSVCCHRGRRGVRIDLAEVRRFSTSKEEHAVHSDMARLMNGICKTRRRWLFKLNRGRPAVNAVHASGFQTWLNGGLQFDRKFAKSHATGVTDVRFGVCSSSRRCQLCPTLLLLGLWILLGGIGLDDDRLREGGGRVSIVSSMLWQP